MRKIRKILAQNTLIHFWHNSRFSCISQRSVGHERIEALPTRPNNQYSPPPLFPLRNLSSLPPTSPLPCRNAHCTFETSGRLDAFNLRNQNTKPTDNERQYQQKQKPAATTTITTTKCANALTNNRITVKQ